jgi:hypothetical protein
MQMLLQSRYLALSVGIFLFGRASAFVPFGDLDELRPQPLAKFCDPKVKTGPRLCKGMTHKTLEDGGYVGLRWEMHADPDRYLSVDLEKEHGVRILDCTASSLVLELPESHVWHARVGQVIVASTFAHRCEHLYNVVEQAHKEQRDPEEPINHNLYHRITKVISTKWHNEDGSLAAGSSKGKKAHVKVWTKELPSIGHAVPRIQYQFEYVPLEAVDPSPWPERQTNDEIYRDGRWLEEENQKHEERRLDNEYDQSKIPQTRGYSDAPPELHSSQFQKPGQGANTYALGGRFGNGPYAWRGDGGAPIFGGQTVMTDDVKDLLSFKPRNVANFGWNWDFRMNSTKDAEYSYSVSGTKMFVLIKKPYVKAHSLIRLRFRSYTPKDTGHHTRGSDTFFKDGTWTSVTNHASDKVPSIFDDIEQPRVKWVLQMKGHAVVRAKLLAQMRATMHIDTNPLKLVQFPILKNFWKPKWFGTLHFNLGHFPISITPGIQFKAKFFHKGIFRGSFGVGVQGHVVYDPMLEYDSLTGIRALFKTHFEDVRLTPPNWMVSTTHFECGVAFEPTLWIKGMIGHQQSDSKAALALRPYMNMTITRHGSSDIPQSEAKELILYPFRIVGLGGSDGINKMYEVKIVTRYTPLFLGQSAPTLKPEPWLREITSTPAYNYGEVEFRDEAQKWSFGLIPEHELLRLYIHVVIVEMDQYGHKTISKSVAVRCRQISNGICSPGPMVAEFPYSGGRRVQVMIHGVWKDSPVAWLMSRLRGITAEVPEVIINKRYIESIIPGFKIDAYVGNGQVSGENANKPMILVLDHGFRSYPMHLNKHKGYVPNFNSSSLTSTQVLELGTSFLSTWMTTCSLNGVRKCDPAVHLYVGDTLAASARLPEIPWESAYQETRNTQHAEAVGATVYKGKAVPISVALRPTGNQGTIQAELGSNVGMVRLMIVIGSPANWNKFIKPSQYEDVCPGQNFHMVWTITDPYLITQGSHLRFRIRFMINTNQPGGDLYVDSTSTPEMVPQMGEMGFKELKHLARDVDLTAFDSHQDTLGVFRPRFQVSVPIASEYTADTLLLACVEWNDERGYRHEMYTRPVPVVSPRKRERLQQMVRQELAREREHERRWAFLDEDSSRMEEEFVAHRKLTEAIAKGIDVNRDIKATDDESEDSEVRELSAEESVEERKLWGFWDQPSTPMPLANSDGLFDNLWNNKFSNERPWADHQCKKRDLNFAFGAGMLWRVWVERLSLPADLPVLGGMFSDSSLMGLPWAPLFPGWSSAPQSLKDHLPNLLCRGGVCSATLPGCPAWQNKRTFYPEIDITFEKTLRFSSIPNGKFQDIIKTGLAYVFAVLPEAVRLIQHYASVGGEKTHWLATSTKPAYVTVPPPIQTVMPGLPPTVAPGPLYTTPAPAPVAPPAPTPAGYTTAPVAPGAPAVLTVPPLTPGRRLEHQEGHQDHVEKHKLTHKVTVSFAEGLPYEVDDKLMDMMIKQGQFADLWEDEDGKAKVVSYSIRHLDPPQKINGMTILLPAVAGSLLAGMVLAFVVRRRGVKLYERVEDSPSAADSNPSADSGLVTE